MPIIEPVPQRIEAVLKGKGGSVQYLEKVYLMKLAVSVFSIHMIYSSVQML